VFSETDLVLFYFPPRDSATKRSRETFSIPALLPGGSLFPGLFVLDFIARLSVQIPDPHERIVLYYGLYSNASRQRRAKGDDEEPLMPGADCSDCDESEWNKSRSIRWEKLIRKVWKEDSLLCTKCGGKMRIISFITDPVVIDKILRHIGWKYCDPPTPR